MKKIYYLSTCDTCKRILAEVDPPSHLDLQDIKKKPISEEELEQLATLVGSYGALFNKRAKLYRERNLKDQDLSEEDYKSLLLEHYTFLKRPVIAIDDQIFVGNSKKTVADAKKAIHDLKNQ